MIIKTAILSLFLLNVFNITGYSQLKNCEISFTIQNPKQIYTCSDTIRVLVKVQLDNDFCDEAGELTKIFSKGLIIKERLKWKRISETTITQKLLLTVQNGKNKGTLTAYRKTGHYNCFEQLTFKIKND